MDGVCAVLVAHMIQTNAPPDEQRKDEKVFYGCEDTTSLKMRKFRFRVIWLKRGQNMNVLFPLIQGAGVDGVMNECLTGHLALIRHTYHPITTFSLTLGTQQ